MSAETVNSFPMNTHSALAIEIVPSGPVGVRPQSTNRLSHLSRNLGKL
jgi:hypothetical protein